MTGDQHPSHPSGGVGNRLHEIDIDRHLPFDRVKRGNHPIRPRRDDGLLADREAETRLVRKDRVIVGRFG